MSRLLTALIAALILFGLASGYSILINSSSIYSLDSLSPNGSANAIVKPQEDGELVERIAELENTVTELTARLEDVEAALGLEPSSTSDEQTVPESPAGESPTVQSNANIRHGPGIDFAIVRALWAGTELEIVGYNDDSGRTWYLLADGGWIADSLVNNAPDNVEYAEAPSEEVKDDWVVYQSDQVHFAALVPPTLVAVEHEPESGNPARAVSFAAEGDDAGPDNTVITVVSLPAVDVPGQQFSVTELKRIARQWMRDNNVTILEGPDEMEMGEYVAVKVVNEAQLTDEATTILGHTAFISTSDAFYYIEVAGFNEYDNLLKSTFDDFVANFTPLD